jgi:hypothetical protein
MSPRKSSKDRGPKVAAIFKEELPVELNDEERAGLGQKLAELDAELDRLTEQKKLAVSEFKTKIDSIELDRRKTYEAMNSGVQMQMVECRESIDFDRNRAVVVRLHTNTEVRERALTGDERAAHSQESFPDGNAAAETPANPS